MTKSDCSLALWVLSECSLIALWLLSESSWSYVMVICKSSWSHPEVILKSFCSPPVVKLEDMTQKDEDWVLYTNLCHTDRQTEWLLDLLLVLKMDKILIGIKCTWSRLQAIFILSFSFSIKISLKGPLRFFLGHHHHVWLLFWKD